MFVVLLTFSDNKAQAGQFMDGHKDWIKRGFDEDVFLLTGSLKPEGGGGILAYNTTYEELLERVATDPFVVENIVKAEIQEIAPAMTDERLSFLKD